jgi:hypothetical protein
VTARLVASLAVGAAGVAVLAHAEPGASWAAVGGWALLLAAWVNVATLRGCEP